MKLRKLLPKEPYLVIWHPNGDINISVMMIDPTLPKGQHNRATWQNVPRDTLIPYALQRLREVLEHKLKQVKP